MQAISVIVTHRADDMTKLPPRLPVNQPKQRKAPAPDRPKLRLGQVAKPSEAAAAGPAPEPSGPQDDALMSWGAEGARDGVEEGVGKAQLEDAPAAFASPPQIHPGACLSMMLLHRALLHPQSHLD